MPKINITKNAVDRLPLTQSGQVHYLDTKLTGFGVTVGQNTKTYFARRQIGRETVRAMIGRHGVFTAEQARQEAIQLLARMARGENVNATKRAERLSSKTVGEYLDRYIHTHPDMKSLTIRTYRRAVDVHLAVWKGRAIGDITPAMVVETHRALGDTVGRPTANNALRVFRAIYAYASIEDRTLPPNPASVLTQTGSWYREQRRTGHLKPGDIQDWAIAVRRMENQTVADLLLLILYTGMRRTEALTLRWENIDFGNRILCAPQTKNGDPLTLPITASIAATLRRRQKAAEDSEWVFPSETGQGHFKEPKKAIAKLRRETGLSFTLHDLRRTFITVAEGLDLSVYALKRLLNHRSGNDVTMRYVVSDVERLREPMERISTRLDDLIARSPLAVAAE